MPHNYIRPHMGLKNRTPANVAGTKVEGENKWLTLTQNVSRGNRSRALSQTLDGKSYCLSGRDELNDDTF